MSTDRPTIQDFLAELIQCTQGNQATTVSMFDVGSRLGLDKTQAGKLAEEVIAEGWAEIKTLSGAIGLTAEGIQTAGADGISRGEKILTLGQERILAKEGIACAEKAMGWIQECIPGINTDYGDIEEIVMDLKTLQVQLQSPKPKSSIVREILRSLQENMKRFGAGDVAARIGDIIEN